MKSLFNVYVILFVFPFLSGCYSFDHQSSPYVKPDHEITKKTAKELDAKKTPPLAETGALQETALNQGFTEKVSRAKDGKRSEKATIIEAVAKDGAKANIEAESLEYSIFLLKGEGFKPHESLNFISNSCDEVIQAQIRADENGKIPAIGLQPAVIGKSGGMCYIDLLREKDSIHINFPWGTEILKSNSALRE